MTYVIPYLKIAADKLDQLRPADQIRDDQPVVTKLDVTRDLAGSLFAGQDWKNRHAELADALEERFGFPFRDNGNSFDTCLQFEGQSQIGLLKVRVKYYWKNLQMLQSESVMKSLGMNCKDMFYPGVRMGRALRESSDYGMSRIEITYTARNREAENELFYPLFSQDSN